MSLIDKSKFKTDAIGTSDAARILGVSGQQVRMAVRTGQLRGYRIGSGMRIRLEDLETYLHACLIEPDLVQRASEPTI
jgi:excisionase family DNA binding protein